MERNLGTVQGTVKARTSMGPQHPIAHLSVRVSALHFAEIASAACNSSSIASHESHESHESQEAHCSTVVLIPSDAAGFYAVEMYRYMYRTAVPCRTCGYMVSVLVLVKG